MRWSRSRRKKSPTPAMAMAGWEGWAAWTCNFVTCPAHPEGRGKRTEGNPRFPSETSPPVVQKQNPASAGFFVERALRCWTGDVAEQLESADHAYRNHRYQHP